MYQYKSAVSKMQSIRTRAKSNICVRRTRLQLNEAMIKCLKNTIYKMGEEYE